MLHCIENTEQISAWEGWSHVDQWMLELTRACTSHPEAAQIRLRKLESVEAY